MAEWMSITILTALGAYGALGVVFAIWFLNSGVSRLDTAAASGPIGFRLIVAPGVVAMWVPLLLMLWRKPQVGEGA